MSSRYQSWGRYPAVRQTAVDYAWRQDSLPVQANFLPQGNARSYGDSCLNADGVVVSSRHLNRFIAFDRVSGVLRAEAGVLLSDILALVEPQGWFLPVTPGTQFVTLGGAVANDVHGKNHHLAGSFGCHVRALELLRSDGERLVCGPDQHSDWFQATVGGLGLTGFITWVELALKPVTNSAVLAETIKYPDLASFFQLSRESDHDFEYTVAWIDCLASGAALGRGHFIRGNHASPLQGKPALSPRTLTVPLDPPISLINALSLKAFNQLYYHRQWRERQTQTVHYRPFFYPLDAIAHWNRIYGPKGFLQYQFVVPEEVSEAAVREVLGCIARHKTGSFLAVLKVFGDVASPGLLSFPRPGATLALDFPYRGSATLALFDQLDAIVSQAGGAIYPAKDAHMSGEHFQQFYPRLNDFLRFRDPGITSSFWQRVMGANA